MMILRHLHIQPLHCLVLKDCCEVQVPRNLTFRCVRKLKLQPVRIGEIDREVSGRVWIWGRRVEDGRSDLLQELVQFLNVRSVLGDKGQMVKSRSISIVYPAGKLAL